jgi:hypothetical protein
MNIRITKKDADYLWDTLKIKDNPRNDNTDEQWLNDEQYYQLYDYHNVVIMAIFDIKDTSAPMDSTSFCDWDKYNELYVVSDMEVE